MGGMTASERNRAAAERAEREPEAVCDAVCVNMEIVQILEMWPRSDDIARTEKVQTASNAIALRAMVSLDIGGQWDGTHDSYMNAQLICRHLACLPRSQRSQDGLSLLAVAVAAMALPMQRRHVIVAAELRGNNPLRLVRSADVLAISTFEALEVDGEWVASTMDEAELVQYRVVRPKPARPGELLPGPRTIAGDRVGEPVLRALATYPLTGDERNPVRGDVYRICLLGYALSGPAKISEEEGVRLLTGGRATDAGRRRWRTALDVTRSLVLRVNRGKGQWIRLLDVDVELDGTARIDAPRWWRERQVWRLTGALFRPTLLGQSGRGTAPGYWGALQRTLGGLESALSWSPSAGRGRDGRIPDLLRPEFGRTGPGPEVRLPWQVVMRLAGEHVEADADPKGKDGRRYRERVRMMKEAGYCYDGRASAEAGDTIEVRPVGGGRGRGVASLVVRASARMVEAVKQSQNPRTWTRCPATRVLGLMM